MHPEMISISLQIPLQIHTNTNIIYIPHNSSCTYRSTFAHIISKVKGSRDNYTKKQKRREYIVCTHKVRDIENHVLYWIFILANHWVSEFSRMLFVRLQKISCKFPIRTDYTRIVRIYCISISNSDLLQIVYLYVYNKHTCIILHIIDV